MLRDFPWIQFYAEDNQEVLDMTLMAFRLAEDHRILLPALVAMDAFIVSHTQAETVLPDQAAVDRYLPELDLPHRLLHEDPKTLGGLAWPEVAMSLRLEIDEAMDRVDEVLGECRAAFLDVFKRDPGGAVETLGTEDAEIIIIVSSSIATTAREIIKQRREAGEKIGLIKIKMFRPFPERALREACTTAKKVAVLDRNYAAGVGGIFWQEAKAAFQGHRDDLIIQDYLTGLCGGDVTPPMIDEVIADLVARSAETKPVWMTAS
jgi:pyruvate/2-oxoacid:ferredoxin oxidoreductase alpha subunit